MFKSTKENQMKEQDYQRKIVNAIEDRGGYTVKTIVTSKKGVPDILACYKGKFIAVEVKTPSTLNNTSKLQDWNLKKINDAGGYAVVAWSGAVIEDLMDLIDNDN